MRFNCQVKKGFSNFHFSFLQIKELNLDNCRSTNIEGLTDEFSALEKLSLINVGLVSLKAFPKLPSLKKLELSDNRISSGLTHLLCSPKLTILNLSGNKIKEFDELKSLASLENLEILDLFNNEVTQVENYREKMFQLMPSLKYLDGWVNNYKRLNISNSCNLLLIFSFDQEDDEAPSDTSENGADDSSDNDGK